MQVFAHRGASHEIAEHTLAAYQEAIRLGADGLECDVRLTADGHLVCIHDRNLRRIASSRGLISAMTLEELNAVDFSSWKNEWADLDDEAPMVDPEFGALTLRTLLDTVASAGRRVEVAVETKHPTRYGGLVERRLAHLLEEFGWTGVDAPVRVMSFSFTALQRMQRLTPKVQLVQLIEKAHHWPMLRPLVDPSWIMGPGIGELRDHPGLGRHLNLADKEIHVWTVNTEADLRLCESLGVTAVMSDRPGYIKGLLTG